MLKQKSSLFLLLTILFFNYLCFSQSNVSYLDLIMKNSNNYKMFQKNFNPLKYDPAIVKNCFMGMINDLRGQLFHSMPLLHLPMLDSVAQLQADFQVNKEKVTLLNEPPLQYTSQRLKLYGFTTQGDEYVSKGKAYQGDNDYSYFDLCLELIKPLLKTSVGVPAVLSPQYTIYGFACGIDRYSRSVYISCIMGNDLTIQVFNSAVSKQKDLPMTRGFAGLRFYDEAICKKCATDNSLEQIYDMLFRDDQGNIFLQSDDAKWVKRILPKAGKYIVLDFIQKEQYNCRVPQVDNNKPFRGIVSKPVSIEKILASNDSTAKSNIFHAKIGSIPPNIDMTKAIDINILLLSDGKNVCRTLIKKNVNNIKTYDATVDSLLLAQNYEEALYRLSSLLSESTITDTRLFSIIQLAAHRDKTYLSSIFTQAVQIAALRSPQELCKLLDQFSVSVFDNKEVWKIYCNTCK